MRLNMKNVTRMILLGICMVVIASCSDNGKNMKITGTLTGAYGKMIYLGHLGLDGISIIDSVKSGNNGSFTFKQEAPKNPEFYILQVDGQQATFTADSAKQYKLSGDVKDLPNTLIVENSPVNNQIKEINKEQARFASTLQRLNKEHDAKTIDDVTYIQNLDSALKDYKKFATGLILSNPASAAAYYAAFQKVGDYLIFNPEERVDLGLFGAVATSWDQKYPNTPRTKHLHDFVLTAMKSRKMAQQQNEIFEKANVVNALQAPDFTYPDVNGTMKKLSDLKGKLVVIDFTVYSAEFSPEHNIKLNGIYNRNKSKGLEIYQVSLDSEEHLWKNAAVNLPWITVRDPQSVYSEVLSQYNLRNIPTDLIIDRHGNIVSRVENYAALESEIAKYL